MTDALLILTGIALLTGGGEALIRGSLGAAAKFRVSPLLSGLVIVGFGTSAPELVVSVDAAIHARPDIAIGNVVGSNIGNILLILGVCALVHPLAVRPLALRRDTVVVIAASVLFIGLAANGVLGRYDGLLLLLALTAYLVFAVITERAHTSPITDMHKQEATVTGRLPTSTWVNCLATLAGLLLLIAGSQVLLAGAVGLATQWGVSEAVIGLTLVAVGTSLPELSISVIATLRRQADVAVGNVLGSNIFNALGILGVSALLQPLPVTARIAAFDQWVMLLASLLLLVMLLTGKRLSRVEGGILLLGYIAYATVSFIGAPGGL
ncbi:calcium/sodium antiporter [Alteromonas sp. ASW11-19]|uniref:Calcium/sodium antiporter n=1 Tax=Alteromonas salexigens TaxID=2982530 RepID=A0ABT2VJ33_9ALTE|nr:calcium/sodium antiporter [Alteromonas salexigens]MCU7553207.1 calcium/sodium antiporter [Alteromonas salexigens]